MHRFKTGSRFLTATVLACAFTACACPQQSGGTLFGEGGPLGPEPASLEAAETTVTSRESAEPRLQAIEIVRRARGVFVYRYKDNFADIDPRKDATDSRRVTDARVIHELKTLLGATEPQEYAPELRVRCLPSWDTGLEFRESAEKRTTVLFSFRCNQMMLFEERAYRDFTPQSVKFYALLNYELNDSTTQPNG